MVAKILDVYLEERLIAERQAMGLDKFDEVWDGVYVMSPMPNDEHQEIAAFLTRVLYELIQEQGQGKVRQGVNLTDRPEEWTKNFRVPDVVVFLESGRGVSHGEFWTGGPDFAVEIVSEGEDPEAKFAFYGGLSTRELLLVHRDPWQLELYGPTLNGMELLQNTEPGGGQISSVVLGLKFHLEQRTITVNLSIEHPDGRTWNLSIETDDA